jgi:hypothetical protein
MMLKFIIKPMEATVINFINCVWEYAPPKVYFLFRKKEKIVMMIKDMHDDKTGSTESSSIQKNMKRK